VVAQDIIDLSITSQGLLTWQLSSANTFWSLEWCSALGEPWTPSGYWNMPVSQGSNSITLPLHSFPNDRLFFRVIGSAQQIDLPPGSVALSAGTNVWGVLKGRVSFAGGNFMPLPPNSGNVTYVQRKLLVFDKANFKDVIYLQGADPTFFSFVLKPLVATTQSDANGYFQVALPPGDYSLFALEKPGAFYANSADGAGDIFVVHIDSQKETTVEFRISYGSLF
jgi:hypothetical protein